MGSIVGMAWAEAGAMARHVMDALNSTLLKPGSPEFHMALWPIVAYWVVAAWYELLDRCNHPSIARWRIVRTQRGKENPVTRWQVFQRVLLQQALQTMLASVFMVLDPQQCVNNTPKGWLHSAVQFVLAMFVMDAWQYWIHRYMHTNTFLYKHIHSTHHRLLIPYAMGALYNHPLEALLLDTVSAGLSMFSTGMTCELATVFFTASTVKTVMDHCNYYGPLNPIHSLFPNRTSYHDVHHDIRGIKSNYSQPFFTYWDHLCGTFLDPADFQLTQKQVDAKLGLVKPSALQQNGNNTLVSNGNHTAAAVPVAAPAHPGTAPQAGPGPVVDDVTASADQAPRTPMTRSRAKQASAVIAARKL